MTYSMLSCLDCKIEFVGRKGSALRCIECRKIKRRKEARDRYRRNTYGTDQLADPICVQCGNVIEYAGKIDRKYCDCCRERDTSYLKYMKFLLELHVYSCFYCGSKVGRQNQPTIDHMIPLSRGGDNQLENLTIACRSCNARKGTKSVEQFKRELILW